MTYILVAFAVGLFIGHKWALWGVLQDITLLDKDFQKLKEHYQDALYSAILAEKVYNGATEEYKKLKKELEDSIK